MDLESVIRAIIGALALAAVFALLRRLTLRRARSAASDGVMVNPGIIFWIGLIGTLFFLSIAVISQTVGKNDTSTIWVLSVFLGLAAGSLLLMLDALLTRHRVTEDGLLHRSFLRGSSVIGWRDVRRFRYAQGMKWWVLETDRISRRVSVAMTNQPAFARAVLAHVPGNAIDAETAEILAQTARGYPPSAFG